MTGPLPPGHTRRPAEPAPESFDAAAALRRVVEQCEADIAYYGDSDDPMNIGRVIGVREVLHAIAALDAS